MHCVGSAVIAAKATPYQREHYLEPIAAGQHVTSLTLSESGMGSHFYLSETSLERDQDHYVVHGVKQFITSGSHADSYVVSAMASGGEAEEMGEFSVLLIDHGTAGTSWLDPWDGVGMRGNSSRGLRLEHARIPVENLLGKEGDHVWYMFDVIVPYFLMAMSGTYLGIAQAALDLTIQHVRTRRYAHSGESLASMPVLQHKVAEMWSTVERTRRLIYHAAQLGDAGDAAALPAILMSKADVATAVSQVTNDAMTLCGGIAYRQNSELARLLRDARAAHVMSPTTDLLKLWAGRTILGQPLL
jgi:isovaleryl-CoA dehydrogenase